MNKNELKLATFVGDKIKYHRKNKNLTQKQLGEKIGKSDNTISNYEKGFISPSQDALFSLARALGVSVDDFFPPIEQSKDSFLQHAEKMMDGELTIEDMQFLRELIKKTLSMNKKDRENFLDAIKFTVEYHNKVNKH